MDKTAAAFSREVGVGHWTVQRWIRGDRMPRPMHLARITLATGGKVTANDFVLQSELREHAVRVVA